MKLTRREYRQDGIFGDFSFNDEVFMKTLEHAWLQRDASFKPIIPEGTYTCVRGTHALSNGVPFETFEVTGVDGHSGLLFHAGNFNADSHGCILCGDTEITQSNGQNMITGSKVKFSEFMARLQGVDTFQLQVINM